jgi:DtxR family Mn-dependent transcriptional regulator
MASRDPEVQTATVEDYLQTIYSLETEGEKVISARLARWRRVTPPTAWATIRRMEQHGLVQNWALAHEQAHHFEHGVTPVIEDRIFEILGKPTTCPHGSPIPGTGATLDPSWVPLDQLDSGESAVLKFISEELEEDNELMGYLDRHELKPGARLTIGEKVPSTGVVSIGTERETVSLSLGVAARIRVDRMHARASR